jgi:hypothetical protein
MFFLFIFIPSFLSLSISLFIPAIPSAHPGASRGSGCRKQDNGKRKENGRLPGDIYTVCEKRQAY